MSGKLEYSYFLYVPQFATYHTTTMNYVLTWEGIIILTFNIFKNRNSDQFV